MENKIKQVEKVLFVSTLLSTINIFMIDHIKIIENYFIVDICANLNQKKVLKNKHYHFNFSRSLFLLFNIGLIIKLKNFILVNQYKFVFTQTPIISFIIRFILRKTKVKVIYFCHGFNFNKYLLNHPFYWLIYLVEKYLSRYTHALITINQEDYNLTKNVFHSKNNFFVNGVGVKISPYPRISIYNPIQLISVGELNSNKNIIVILKALAKIKREFKLEIPLRIFGKGEKKYTKIIQSFIRTKKLNSVKLLGHSNNIEQELLRANVFVFPSKREGLGIAAIEAMNKGLALITSNVQGINDYSHDGMGSLKCNPKDYHCFSNAILTLNNNPHKASLFGSYNFELAPKFSFEKIKPRLIEIYRSIFSVEK